MKIEIQCVICKCKIKTRDGRRKKTCSAMCSGKYLIYRQNTLEYKTHAKIYQGLPEIKAQKKIRQQSSKAKARAKQIRDRPENKVKRKAYRDTPEYKAKAKARKSTPEYKIKLKEYRGQQWYREYQRKYHQRPENKVRMKKLKAHISALHQRYFTEKNKGESFKVFRKRIA